MFYVYLFSRYIELLLVPKTELLEEKKSQDDEENNSSNNEVKYYDQR